MLNKATKYYKCDIHVRTKIQWQEEDEDVAIQDAYHVQRLLTEATTVTLSLFEPVLRVLTLVTDSPFAAKAHMNYPS